MSLANRAVSDYSTLSFEKMKERKESKEVFPHLLQKLRVGANPVYGSQTK